MQNTKLNRRTMLAGAATLPAAAAALSAAPAAADGHGAAPNAIKHSFKVGDMEVATLLSGSAVRDNIQSIFGMNVSPEEFSEVSAANFIPDDRSMFVFTPTVVKTGDEVVLFDTGLSAKGLLPALKQAGYGPEDITTVVPVARFCGPCPIPWSNCMASRMIAVCSTRATTAACSTIFLTTRT